METNRLRKTIAILLAVMFLLTVTVGAVSAQKIRVVTLDHREKLSKEDISSNEVNGKKPSVVQGSDDTNQRTNVATCFKY